MPIHFDKVENKNYFISTWTGKISDDEMITGYTEFYKSLDWSTHFNELVDLSQADMSKITTEGLNTISDYIHKLFEVHNIPSSKTAVYSPKLLEYGIARMYQEWTRLSAENVKVFKELDDAKSWIEE